MPTTVAAASSATVATSPDRSVSRLSSIWHHPLLAVTSAAIIVIVFALISAFLAPRGPVTTGGALTSILMALVVGVMTGLITGSRWAIVVAPALFIAVFEVARVGIEGPTVDGIHLGSALGLIAFVVGRVFHGALVLVPMMLGARYGVALASRLGNGAASPMGGVTWVWTTIVAVALVGLGVMLARPVTATPILGADGEIPPGSISELLTIPIGGIDQSLMIRGRSVDNPVLLHLAGGPGGTDLGAMRADVTLEQDFVVVIWDQRGTGKSYPGLDPTTTLTPEQMESDTIELTEYLRDRFDEEKIFLSGNSWGTILGVMAVQERPDLYHAYVGTGQMVSPTDTDVMFYEDTMAWAERTGNQGLAATMRRNGPPPYDDLLLFQPVISHEHDWNPYPGLDTGKEMPFNLLVPENSLIDRVNAMRGLLDTFAVLYPQIQDVDLRTDAASLQVPVYMVTGAHEARGRAVLADEWFEMLDTPQKEKVVFERSGHRPSFEEPAAFATLMNRVREEALAD